MADSYIKRVEIIIRRLLIRLFGICFRRKRLFKKDIDFNSCKFLFIRQDKIGDVLVSTPLFALLKKYYPNAIVDILLSEKNHFVLDNDPLINKRWIYKKEIFSAISMVASIRKDRYDFAIDLMDNPSTTSTMLCLLAGAKWNVGIEKGNSFVYDIIVPMLSRKETHIVERVAQLLLPFNIDVNSEKLLIRYCTSKDSDEYVNTFIKHNGITNQLIIGINISAGSDVRFWGIDNFKKLISCLQNTYPAYKLLLLYQPSDANRAKEIAESARDVILTPITSTFDQFAAFIKILSFLITPDTAAVHLASAFKIPAVVLYVQSNKALRIWEPYGTENECLITDVDDLSKITVSQVRDAFQKLFKRSKKSS